MPKLNSEIEQVYQGNGQATTHPLLSLRKERLDSLISHCLPVPSEWVVQGPEGQSHLEPKECVDWSTLISTWGKALRWTEGLDRALSIALACITSTRMPGQQLWATFVSPPSGGKTTICEALSVSKKYVYPRSTIKGFYSGYQSDKEGEKDWSLAALIRDRALVTKDGDTLLKAPNRDQVLAEARDLYDGSARTSFKNKTSREYHNHRCVWLLWGTPSLYALDTAELGERFFRIIIMERMDQDMEDDICDSILDRIARTRGVESNGKASRSEMPELVEAKCLTGGYIRYLRENATRLLRRLSPEIDKGRLRRYARFAAHFRARCSKHQSEVTSRELSFRLAEQLYKLSLCLAVVMNRDSVDEEVMRRIRQVALDTARGKTLTLADALYQAGNEGKDTKFLSLISGDSEDYTRGVLKFMRRIEVVELHNGRYWRLTKGMRELYRSVVYEGGSF